MYMGVRAHACACVCVSKTIMRKEKGKRKRREIEKLLIQINTQTGRKINRHKSFIDMRYNTEQYSKSNSIALN